MLVLGLGALVLATAAAAAPASGYSRDTTPLPKAVADAGDEPAGGASERGGGGGGTVLRVLIGLGVVLGTIYGLQYLIRRQGGNKGLRADGSLALIATMPLGPNRAVHLLRVGHELVLIGSAEGGVRALRVYDAAESERLAAALGTDPGTAGLRSLPPPGAGGGGSLLEGLRRRTAR